MSKLKKLVNRYDEDINYTHEQFVTDLKNLIIKYASVNAKNCIEEKETTGSCSLESDIKFAKWDKE